MNKELDDVIKQWIQCSCALAFRPNPLFTLLGGEEVRKYRKAKRRWFRDFHKELMNIRGLRKGEKK